MVSILSLRLCRICQDLFKACLVNLTQVNGIVGFYKSVYVDENGVKRSIATSKFQPTYARSFSLYTGLAEVVAYSVDAWFESFVQKPL